jgi:signal transduction histidine kinase
MLLHQEGGQIVEIVKKPFDVNEVVSNVMESFRYRASQKGLELTATLFPENMAAIESDPVRLSQVLTNFIDNAVKFTNEGGSVKISITECDKGTLCFDVTDTGIGIPASAHGVIFEPFSQVDTKSTRKHGGAGLGTVVDEGQWLIMVGQAAHIFGYQASQCASASQWQWVVRLDLAVVKVKGRRSGKNS